MSILVSPFVTADDTMVTVGYAVLIASKPSSAANSETTMIFSGETPNDDRPMKQGARHVAKAIAMQIADCSATPRYPCDVNGRKCFEVECEVSWI